MATADYWSSADLKGVAFGGLINEDVMQQIIDVLDVDTPLTNMIGSDSVDNSYTEWTNRIYPAGDTTNAVVDGEDVSTYNTRQGRRVGNHCQISRKVFAVTTRARQSDTVGYSDEYAEQLMFHTEALRRDLEAISLTNQTSQADDGDSSPGLIGGLNSWLTSNTVRGAGGVDGGFANGVVTGATLGTIQAITETAVRDVCQGIYESGFNPTVLMARPAVIRKISEYFFTDTARVGIQQTETGKSGPSTAVGSVKVFISDFDTDLTLTPNRLQPLMNGTDNDSAFILTPAMLRHGFLHNFRTEPIAKLGLSDRAQVAVDWTLKVLAEEAHGVVGDIDASTAMTA